MPEAVPLHLVEGDPTTRSGRTGTNEASLLLEKRERSVAASTGAPASSRTTSGANSSTSASRVAIGKAAIPPTGIRCRSPFHSP